MLSFRSRPATPSLAATLVLALVLALPSAVRAGEIMDSLSPQSRLNVDKVVRYAVEYDACRGDWQMNDTEADAFVALLSEVIKELPQYTALDSDARKVLLLNLLVEMQQAASAAPAPDCRVVRVKGQRAALEDRPARG